MKLRWTLVGALCLASIAASGALAGDGAGAATKSPAAPARPATASQTPATTPAHSMVSDSSKSANSHPATMSQPAMTGAHVKLSKDDVKAIQTALRQAGDDPGSVDGVLGRKTKAALRSYQKAHSLKVTGWPDEATCAQLGVKSATHSAS